MCQRNSPNDQPCLSPATECGRDGWGQKDRCLERRLCTYDRFLERRLCTYTLYICTYMYIYAYGYDMYMYTYVCVCVYTYIHTYMHT